VVATVTDFRANATLPHHHEAEMSVVGGILLHGKSLCLATELIGQQDFYDPVLGAIFAAMVNLDAASKPIDSLSVTEQMKVDESYGRLRAKGGEAFLSEIMSAVVSVENLGYYAKIIRDKATTRRLIESGHEIAAKGYGDYSDVQEYVEQSEKLIFDVSSRLHFQSYESSATVAKAVTKMLEQRSERGAAVTGVPSGFFKLDEITCGFQPSELIIVAARPSMGKTSLVMNFVEHAAIEHRVPAIIFSLEMSKEALFERMQCGRAGLDLSLVKKGLLEPNDWIKYNRATTKVATAPISVDDTGSPTLSEIRSKARRWRADPAIFKPGDSRGIVVVDYLQLIIPPADSKKGRANREQEVAEMSRGLKALAKELRMPVIAVAQLNRAVESRTDKRPVMSDLRESGAIEQDADVITFIYRDEVYNAESSEKGIAEVLVAKQRNGATGLAKLTFRKQQSRFGNQADPNHYSPPRDYTDPSAEDDE